MSKSMRNLAATAFVAAGLASFASAASAMPFADGLALKNAAPSTVESVRWGGRGWGWGAGAGLVAGAIVGGALLAPHYYAPRSYYYGPGPYYAPGPYYPDPGPVYADPGPYADPSGGGDPVSYCMQRFRSYDPRSGTYLGYDGLRHPCP
jgi:BA14K-like protein